MPVEYDVDLRNPWRNDEEPGCRFYIHKQTGRIRFKDFSYGFNWDCFDVAQLELETDNFQDTLRAIASDFKLVSGETMSPPLNGPTNQASSRRIPSEKRLIVKGWNTHYTWKQLRYWDRYEVTGVQLEKMHVYNYSKAYILEVYEDGEELLKPVYAGRYELKFAYYFGNKEWKLYFPERPKTSARFIQVNASIMQGWEYLPDKDDRVIITKSYKDVVCLKGIDAPAVAPQSENIVIPKGIITGLEARFNYVYLLYDNDIPGLRAATNNVMAYSNLIPLVFAAGEQKDYPYHVERYGKDKMKETMYQMFNNHENDNKNDFKT
jgi:hypothetical protein